MPNVEELEPTYLDYTVQNENSVIRHWIGKGASGWRLDVADELPDEFIRKLRIAADEAASSRGDEAVIIGEVWEDASNKVSYGILRSYFTDKELHSVTNYPFRNSILAYFEGSESAELTIRRFKSLMENYPVHNFYALINMTGTHDVERLMTVMLRISDGDISAAKRLVKAYAAVMFTFPGVPLVYYGDETCVEGGTDPDNRRTYPWAREDGDMINHFSELARLRRGSDVLTGGFIEFINARNTESDCSAVAYMRYNRDGLNVFGGKAEKNKTNYIKVICAVNRYGRSGESIELSGLTPEECFTVISSDGKPQRGALCGVNSDGRLFLEAVGTYVLLGVPGAAYR